MLTFSVGSGYRSCRRSMNIMFTSFRDQDHFNVIISRLCFCSSLFVCWFVSSISQKLLNGFL